MRFRSAAFSLLLLCLPAQAWAAIAFVAAADGGNNSGSTTSLTFSYTVGSGSDRMLAVFFAGDNGGGADDVSSVTYNGVAMSLAVKNVGGSSNRYVYMYYLLAPASGAHNVVITVASSHYILAGAADYTGVGSPQPDATTTTPFASVGGGTVTASLTTVANNSWALVMADISDNTQQTGASTTVRTFDGAFTTWSMADTNGPLTPAGSQSVITYWLGTSGVALAVASFCPVGACITPASKKPIGIFPLIGQ